jgi:hypothetical protein
MADSLQLYRPRVKVRRKLKTNIIDARKGLHLLVMCSSIATERGAIGKPVMQPRSGLLVRNAGDFVRPLTMAKQSGVKRSIVLVQHVQRVRRACVNDVGILYDFRTGKHGFRIAHRHAKVPTDNWL